MPRTTHWTPVAARLDDETLAVLDRCQAAEGLTRSEMLRRMINRYGESKLTPQKRRTIRTPDRKQARDQGRKR